MVAIVGQAFTPTGLSSPQNDLTSIAIYPNPTQDIVYIKSQYPVQGLLFDMNGTLLQTIAKGQQQFTLQSLKTGMYILVLKDDKDHYISHKIIKK